VREVQAGYRALALQKPGQADEAGKIFRGLLEASQKMLNPPAASDQRRRDHLFMATAC
jgi:hypothetical protein